MVVNMLNEHLINHGFPCQWKIADTELYQYARDPSENMMVLSYASDSATHTKWPFEWVINFGKGRVYNSSMGHLWNGDIYPNGYRCIAFQTSLIRAVEWLATGESNISSPCKISI